MEILIAFLAILGISLLAGVLILIFSHFFAVEKNPSVLSMACKKALAENITNVRFFNCSAEYLARVYRRAYPDRTQGRLFLRMVLEPTY